MGTNERAIHSAAPRQGGRVHQHLDHEGQDQVHAGVGVPGPEERLLEGRGGLRAAQDPEQESAAGLDGHEAEDEDAGQDSGGVGEFHVDTVYRRM
jgi:hypothetical protein